MGIGVERWAVLALVVAISAVDCAGVRPTDVGSDTEIASDDRLRRGLKLAENGNLDQALVELHAAQAGQPSALGTEAITRVEQLRAADSDKKRSGNTDGWIRGQLARLRAEDLVEAEEWSKAAVGFEAAYQFMDDPQMLFESALAFTKAEQWSETIAKFETYLIADRKAIMPERAYSVTAELDRLRAIVAGEEPVTWESLADHVYTQRQTGVAPLAAPLSVQEDVGLATEPDAQPEVTVVSADDLPATTLGPKPAPLAATPDTAVEQVAATPAEPSPPTLEELLFYSVSRSSSVRLRAVRDLVSQSNDRARLALERRVIEDTTMRVRIAATEALVARGSLASLPVLRKAIVTAATSQERAVLKRAVAELMESTRF